MFYLLMPSLESRQRLIEHLKARGILSVFPLPCRWIARPWGRRYGQFHCPQTQRVAGHLLRLPLYNDLSEQSQAQIIDAIQEFRVDASDSHSEDLAQLAFALAAEPVIERTLSNPKL